MCLFEDLWNKIKEMTHIDILSHVLTHILQMSSMI